MLPIFLRPDIANERQNGKYCNREHAIRVRAAVNGHTATVARKLSMFANLLCQRFFKRLVKNELDFTYGILGRYQLACLVRRYACTNSSIM